MRTEAKTRTHATPRRYAYTALLNSSLDGAAYILGRCDEGEPGFTVVPGLGFPSHEAARANANMKNEDLGVSETDAALIVLSTMRARAR